MKLTSGRHTPKLLESDDDDFGCSLLPYSGSNSVEAEILEGSSEGSGSGDETEPDPLPALEILNSFCLKIMEEALLSSK